MFTGIISGIGQIDRVDEVAQGRRLSIVADWPDRDLVLGESITVDGCCLTAVALDGARFEVEVSAESLARTTLGGLASGSRVNLERAMRISDRLGGHLVSGHVDGTGRITAVEPVGECHRYVLEIPEELIRYCVEKGSLCVDGISLTLNGVDDARRTVELMIIPHTRAATTLGEKGPGSAVNLEADLVGKYVERMLGGRDGRTRAHRFPGARP